MPVVVLVGTFLFLRNNLDIEGIDYSEEAISQCDISFLNINFYVGNFVKIEKPDEYYDGIWTCASMLNISKVELPTLLLEFRRVLKPAGLLFASEKEGDE